MSEPICSITCRTRLFPSKASPHAVTTPLSIIDPTVARFTSTGATWLFPKPNSTGHSIADTIVTRLRAAFIAALDSYPQWAGQLQWTTFSERAGHTTRFGRLELVHGTQSDPGVGWEEATHSGTIDSILPIAVKQDASVSNVRIRKATAFPQTTLISDSKLALHDFRESAGLPSMCVKITTFACGGYAIGATLAHPLGDAQSLMGFMHLWAATTHPSRSTFDIDPPVFNPTLLDQHAAGDIDGPEPDPALIELSHSLPIHRFDWWHPSAPAWAHKTNDANKPPHFSPTAPAPPSSSPPPWHTWSFVSPVSLVQLSFPPETLSAIRASARSSAGRNDISRLDALLAHLWILIVHARRLESSSDAVYLNVTLGVRTRTSPPLPSSFVGSPIFIAHASSSAHDLCASGIPFAAGKVRDVLTLFTPDRVAAYLHDQAHAEVPQRLWAGFVGERHTLVTSWMRIGVEEIEFFDDGGPVYVQAVMPLIDGCVQLMETKEGGINVSLALEEETMNRLLTAGVDHVDK